MQTEELVEEIAALEHHLAEAQQAGNRAALDHLVAPDYAGINAQGHPVDQQTFIDAFLAPHLRINSLVLENLSVRIFEHVAVATGIAHVRGLLRHAPFRERYHFTDVWVRRLMHWEVVAGHVSLMSVT